MDDRRKKTRIDSFNFIDYSCLDKNRQVIGTGMGKTVNVSEGGILLETHTPIDVTNDISIVIGLQEELVDIIGFVKYCKETENKMFQSGVEFLEMDQAARSILKRYIEAFHKHYQTQV